jgi:hypothetical protein
MTAPVVVEGLTPAELDAQVQALVIDGCFDTAIECITEWIAWDWYGRWDDTVLAPETDAEPVDTVPAKQRASVRGRLLEEFGDLGNYA